MEINGRYAVFHQNNAINSAKEKTEEKVKENVDEKYRLGKTYLKDEQQELLERLLPSLNGKDAEVMKSIIRTFGLKGATK